jgi:hypothetical protein
VVRLRFVQEYRGRRIVTDGKLYGIEGELITDCRSRLVLQPQNIFPSVEALQAAEKRDHTSLGLVRPKEIKRIHKIRKKESERKEWNEAKARAVQQRELFMDPDSMAKELAFCPVEYRVKFTCDDSACTTEHDFGIRDWGLYVLDYNQWAERGGAVAEEKVVEKIQQLMDPSKRDPYFFLGNTKGHSHSFMVVGLFHPPLTRPTTTNEVASATPMLPGIF